MLLAHTDGMQLIRIAKVGLGPNMQVRALVAAPDDTDFSAFGYRVVDAEPLYLMFRQLKGRTSYMLEMVR